VRTAPPVKVVVKIVIKMKMRRKEDPGGSQRTEKVLVDKHK